MFTKTIFGARFCGNFLICHLWKHVARASYKNQQNLFKTSLFTTNYKPQGGKMDRLYNKYFLFKWSKWLQCNNVNFLPLFCRKSGGFLPLSNSNPPPRTHTHLEPVDLGLGLRPSSSLSTFHFPPLALKLIKNPKSKATAY